MIAPDVSLRDLESNINIDDICLGAEQAILSSRYEFCPPFYMLAFVYLLGSAGQSVPPKYMFTMWFAPSATLNGVSSDSGVIMGSSVDK